MKYYFLALGTLVVVCVGCSALGDGQQILDNGEHSAPPAEMMMRPGPMVDGPGPGVLAMYEQPQQGRAFATKTTQILFTGPQGMQIGWQIPNGYAENQLTAAGRYNFTQGSTYRLKFTQIPGRQLTVYPTLEVYPAHPTTDSYLSHNSVPVDISDEDLDQIETNNFVTKVVYLPDPKFQELAIAGVETLVSTRLDPGVDPVAEADRRGTIMSVLRMGNMDLEMPGQKTAFNGGLSGGIQQTGFVAADGDAGQFVPPVPIAGVQGGMLGVPSPMIAGGPPAGPMQSARNPIAGVGGAPQWGMTMTSTPIGLPGPPHLPFGGPAGLKSHTVLNRTKQNFGQPVDHFVMDVQHKPGLSLPDPVKYVKYSETHPSYKKGEVAYPAWTLPGQGAPAQP